MISRKNALFLVCLLVSLPACKDRASGPTEGPSGSAMTTPETPAQPTSATPPATTPAAPSLDTWFVIGKDGNELGVLELRSGQAPKLLPNAGADVKALEAKLNQISGPGGIGLDMHLPTGDGKRGPYGTQIVKPGDSLYKHAVKEKLEPEFRVQEVPELADPMPPAKLKKLQVSRSGEKVGLIDFTTSPPTLSVQTDKSDGIGIKNNMEWVQELNEVKLRYHQKKDGVETLFSVSAKPGDTNYAQSVALFLILVRDYRTRYAYKLDFIE
jgi:hypothetical protein